MKRAVLDQLRADRAAGRAAVLATWLDGGAQRVVHPWSDDEGAPDWLLERARQASRADRSGTVEGPEGEVFLQVHNPPLRMIVVGAVHIAQHLCPMAARAGFEVAVVDPRGAFATAERFPGVDVRATWPRRVFDELAPDRRTAVITLTHDPKIDDQALTAALRSPAFYVGALGSTRTQGKRRARLAEQGFSEHDLDRIHGPVGLDIGARSPAEIALATLAEVIAVLRTGAAP